MSVKEEKVLSVVIPCYNEKDNILNIVKLVLIPGLRLLEK